MEAHQAALDVDAERGIADGFAEVIEHCAAGVQTEIYGPADLRQARQGINVSRPKSLRGSSGTAE